MAHGKVQPGQKFRQTPFYRAAFINDAVDVVNAFKEGRIAGERRGVNASSSRVVVEVRNSTGEDRELGEAVQLTGHLLDDVSQEHPWFDAELVAEPVLRRLAILTRPLKDGAIGPAQLAGVCLAKVDVTDADHTHAMPVDGDAVLASGYTGPLELLMEPDGTGEQVLWVLMLKEAQSIFYGETAASHAKGATGTIKLRDPSDDSLTSEEIENVRNVYVDLEAERACHGVYIGGVPMLIAGDCETEEE